MENLNDTIMRNCRYDNDVLNQVEKWFGIKINRNSQAICIQKYQESNKSLSSLDPIINQKDQVRTDQPCVPICQFFADMQSIDYVKDLIPTNYFDGYDTKQDSNYNKSLLQLMITSPDLYVEHIFDQLPKVLNNFNQKS